MLLVTLPFGIDSDHLENMLNQAHTVASLMQCFDSAFAAALKREKRKAYVKQWVAANPEKRRAYKRKWELKNPDKVAASQRRKYERHGEEYRAKRRLDWATNPELKRAERRADYAKNKKRWLSDSRKRAYGITQDDYDRMFAAQNGKCLICELVFDGVTPRQEHIDHCHETGVVRGILCTDCNLGLGRFKDNPATHRRAIAYLAQHGKPLQGTQ